MNEYMMIEQESKQIETTFDYIDYVADFLDWLDRTDKTKEAYMKNLKAFFKWMTEEGIMKPSRQDVMNFKAHLQKSGYQATTIQAYINSLKQFFKWLVYKGIYDKDITEGIKSGKVNKLHRKDSLSKDEFLDILSQYDNKEDIQSLRDKAIILLEGICGLRCIEVERMNVDDIQSMNGIKVLYLQRKGHTTKDSFIPIPYKVEKAIRRYLYLRSDIEDKDHIFSSPSNKGKAMFTSLSHKEEQGSRLTTRSISRLIKNQFNECQLEGLDKKSAHSLRHFFATENLNQGTPLKAVSEAMGHSSVLITQIYIQKDDILKNKAFEGLTGLLDD